MSHQSDEIVEVAALSRPFSLGMLYDCRKDSLVPGITLWDHADLKKDLGDRPQNHNDFQIISSESVEDKTFALNVHASLKASFLSGMVEVEGSAKYLNDSKSSKNQARVTLKYEATTRFKQLTMNHLGRTNVKHPYVFDQGLATHVVTGILYGAQAFFVFDREMSEDEHHQDIHGNMKSTIQKIPYIAIDGKGDGEGSLGMKDQEKVKVDKFSCRFFGDFCLQKSPTTFQDAIQVYQSLPALLGKNGENAIPMKVWMLPLTSLDPSAAKLVRQISLGLVQEAQSFLEGLTDLEMRWNDALKTSAAQHFPQVGEKLERFKELCSQFRLGFQQDLAKKLPSIRGGGEEEVELAEILKKRRSSAFNNTSLNQWMDCKERELYTLMSLTEKMRNTKIIQSQSHLYKEALSSDHVVCFVFTSLGSEEPYLSALSDHLRGTKSADPDPNCQDVEKEQWFASKEVMEKIRKQVKLFSDFSEANQEKNLKFLTVGLTDEEHKGSTIYLYKDGFTVSQNFEPPSQPESVTVADRSHNSVTLKISPPRFGAENVTSYSVEFCVHGQDGWKQKTEARCEEVTVRELSPNTEYVFRCRAGTSAGVGPAHVVHDPIKTLPCSPPGEPHVEPNLSDASVTWKKPAEIGQDVQISHYILEFTERVQQIEEDLKWKQLRTSGEEAIISDLQPETKYTVRVRCDCGEAGSSKETQTVSFCTTKFTRPSELLLRMSEKISSGPPSVYKLPLTEEDKNLYGCRSFTFGEKSIKPNRTIMVIGAAGAGKSTLLNGMINYILGVQWEDEYRFKLVDEGQSKSQAHSPTTEVTVYKLYHQDEFEVPFSLTIIDTPGFGDTRGTDHDREITEQLHNLFSSQNGISEIDAVCFVVHAPVAPLTQKYVFDSILSKFGKDIAENIRILVTFADGQKPPVLEAIRASGIPCPKTEDGLPVHFKFNNSALFADNTAAANSMNDEDDDENLDQMFWNMGTKSMKRFFSALNLIKTKILSLTLTNEVLFEQKLLEFSVENLQKQVKLGLDKLEEIKETNEKMKEIETKISKNENFEFEVTVNKPFQIDISSSGQYITNCQACHFTCHYPCRTADDSTTFCTVCPGKCAWNVHFNQKYRWEYKNVKEKRTVKELKEIYEKATGEKITVEGLFNQLKTECDCMQVEVMKLIQESSICLNRLKEIALKPNPLSTPKYIELLIEGEKRETKPGWKKRVESLMKMKEKAEFIAEIETGEKSVQEQNLPKTKKKEVCKTQ